MTRLQLAAGILLSLTLSGMTGVTRAGDDTCRSLQQALALDSAGNGRCVADAGYRETLARERAGRLAGSHNRTLDIFIDADKKVASFSRFASVAAVPEPYRGLG